MLPNLSNTVRRFGQPIDLMLVKKSTVDFEEVLTISYRSVNATVQAADYERLGAYDIDWSLEYVWVHSVSDFEVGEYLHWKGKFYKFIPSKDYQDYGYTEGIGEQVKDGNLIIKLKEALNEYSN